MQTLILNHYPPIIKRIKDVQQIAKAEDLEFSKLNTCINEAIHNMFVFTANERGVERFEKMLGITPKTTQSLDDRKIYISSMMNRRKMSLSELTAMLSNYCEDIELINDTSKMEMIVKTQKKNIDIFIINDILDEVLPMNILYKFSTKTKMHVSNEIFAVQKNSVRLKVKAKLQKNIKMINVSRIGAALSVVERIKIESIKQSE